MYSYGPPHIAEQKQDDQHEHTFSNYVRIRDVFQKTCQRRWTIGKSGERGSGISMLPARHDDDDDDDLYVSFIVQVYCSSFNWSCSPSPYSAPNRLTILPSHHRGGRFLSFGYPLTTVVYEHSDGILRLRRSLCSRIILMSQLNTIPCKDLSTTPAVSVHPCLW